jgi:hypothetical protein
MKYIKLRSLNLSFYFLIVALWFAVSAFFFRASADQDLRSFSLRPFFYTTFSACLSFRMYLSVALFASALLMPASGTALSSRSLSGEATFYGGNLAGGACLLSTYALPSGVFGTSLSGSNWDDSGNCGACVSVTGPDGNSITAMVCKRIL